MTSDTTLRQADELLAELIELVETARSLPMSSSCVLPRERLLDVLDELREVLPPELDESRKVIAARDTLLHNAFTEAAEARKEAAATADALLSDAEGNAERVTRMAEERAYDLVTTAEQRAHELVTNAEQEQGRLLAASTVQHAAQEASHRLRSDAESYRDTLCGEADEYNQSVRDEADTFAREARAEAERYATKLVTDAETYAESTLEELAATLRRAASTAEQGRLALAERRAGSFSAGGVAAPAAQQPWPNEPYDHAQSA